ncbi:MAG: OmcA/MtrC family decaheme c-type cytochrome [Woeseiaceae bacterium]|nr:OmcA/MtrC family decaheme c-type cytochrome [Woeseiaceae bacterium]
MLIFKNFWARFAAIAVLGVALAACSGDDGKTGPAGPSGPAGPQGPSGPPGPGQGIPVDSAELINIEVTSISVPAGGGAPVVDITLTNDLTQGLFGLPAGQIRFVIAQLSPGSGGGSSEWQSYVTRDSAGIPDAQATTETATAGTWVDNGDGTYQYTFAQALTAYPAGPAYDETKTHRLGIEIRGQAPISSNGIITFVPTGGDPLFERRIVDNNTCFACHDIINFHGGPRTDIDYCVTCHNPYSIDGDSAAEPWGGTVDMTPMIHKIHYGENLTNGYFIFGFGGRIHDYSDVVFPQDVRNCTTCHEEDDANTPQASNWREVPNKVACGSCHDDIDWDAGDHPGGINNDDSCVVCHGPESSVQNGELRVEVVHELPVQISSQNYQYNIENVLDMTVGSNPTVEFSVTNPNDGSYYDILNDPEWTTCAGGASRLQIGIAWNTDDYTNTNSGSDPAQPMSAGLNALACFGNPGATPVAGSPGWFSVTTADPLPADATGTAAVTIDGHPAETIDGSVERIPVRNVIEYVGIDGGAADPRREVVDIANCNNCHQELVLHGNNRTDEPAVCVTCHNPNATDARQRVPVADPDDPPTDCVNVLGADDVTIDMKVMVHAIHAGGATGETYEVCGFRNSVHTYDFAYPGRLNNCEGCHNEGTYFPVDPSAVLGTTVDVGADPTPIDDVAISPNTAVCSTCHTSDLARNHMVQNGGDFNAGKAADSTLISSGVETCELCHGEGRSADVEEVHGVRNFPLN